MLFLVEEFTPFLPCKVWKDIFNFSSARQTGQSWAKIGVFPWVVLMIFIHILPKTLISNIGLK